MASGVETPCPRCGDTRQLERVTRETWFCATCGSSWPADRSGPLGPPEAPTGEGRVRSPATDVSGNLIDGDY